MLTSGAPHRQRDGPEGDGQQETAETDRSQSDEVEAHIDSGTTDCQGRPEYDGQQQGAYHHGNELI